MFVINFDFNVIFILILITMMLIGYVTGANIEIIKLIRIYVPFIVVFYLGGPLSRFIYKIPWFQDLITNADFLRDLPYLNTLVMLLATMTAFFGSFLIIGIIIKIIKKQIQSEVVSYKLGKFNNWLGAVIAVGRFYIIISLFVLPFYILGFTTTDDLSTSLIMKYPPPYTQVGRLIHSTEPALKASNSLTTFLDVVDVNQLKKNYYLVTNLEQTLENYDQQVSEACSYMPGSINYPYLYSYINDENLCDHNEELKVVLPYKGLIKWVIDEDIDLTNILNDDLIRKFNEDYQQIIDNTDDEKMRVNLNKAYESSRIYLVVNDWLSDTLEEKYTAPQDIFNDENIETIMEQLVIDQANDEEGIEAGLFYRLSELNWPKLNGKLTVIKKFVSNYHTEYKYKMNNMADTLPFKYKLIASMLKDVDFMPALERTPLIAMYVIDSLVFLDKNHVEFIAGESVYRTFIRIAIPLYLLKTDDNGETVTFTALDMKDVTEKLDAAFSKNIITDEFFCELMFALVDNQNGSSYLDELLAVNPETNKALMDESAVSVLKTYFNSKFSSSSDGKVLSIKESLSKAGENDG